MSGLMRVTNILHGSFGVADKNILRVKILDQNYRDNSRFFKAVDEVQVEISEEPSIVWVPGGINWNLNNIYL